MNAAALARPLSALALWLAVTGCVPTSPDADEQTHEEYVDTLRDAGLENSRLGETWLSEASRSLRDPVTTELPHYEAGAFLPHEARAIAYAFQAVSGQTLIIEVVPRPESTGRLFVDLFKVRDVDERHDPVLAWVAGDRGEIPLRTSGTYVIRLQPELLATVIYDLRLELEAAVRFPVPDVGQRAVQSRFGDPRDAGRRRHEGIDIFAPRSTPVIAVADGTAVARTNRLGGNTVWLSSGDARYYYAHLERAAFSGRRRVTAGDLIGFVGNSGNARTTPTHLHFGLYRSFSGAVDPLPYLQSLLLESQRQATIDTGFAETTASELNLRSAPRVGQRNVRTTLPRGSIARRIAGSGDWLLIRTTDGTEGWIHKDFQRSLAPAAEAFSPEEPALIYPAPGRCDLAPLRFAPEGSSLRVFGRQADALLVGDDSDGPLGWLGPCPASGDPVDAG